MKQQRAPTLAALALIAGLGFSPAHAVDNMNSTDAPDLTSVRAKIKAMDYAGALAQLRKLADDVQHADVYNLLGFTLRNLGDYKQSLTYYQKALDFDPNHKGAHEYLGELYVKLGDKTGADREVQILQKLCPSGCEELADLRTFMATETADLKTN